jgi:hypothetical protein
MRRARFGHPTVPEQPPLRCTPYDQVPPDHAQIQSVLAVAFNSGLAIAATTT